MRLSQFSSYKDRARALAKHLHIDLEAVISSYNDDLSKTHCENLIGSVAVPIGVAGPLTIEGEHARGSYYVPLATTEGALVASVNRGCKALSLGKTKTTVEYIGATRGPVFKTQGIKETIKTEQWILEHMDILSKATEETSEHITLADVNTQRVGRYIYVRCVFHTDQAMGMNMATIAAQHISRLIVKHTQAELIAVAGNYDVDKKPAWLNQIEGRGYRVHAETIIPSATVKELLKTTPDRFIEVWKAKCMIGSAMAGSMGFNAHVANIIAAVFIATGQDPAHVVDASTAITIAEKEVDGGLHVSVTIPDLMIGLVGGGMKLTTQTQARSITKTTTVMEFAEIIGAGVLAGEVSLLGSLAEGTLARSHSKLGR